MTIFELLVLVNLGILSSCAYGSFYFLTNRADIELMRSFMSKIEELMLAYKHEDDAALQSELLSKVLGQHETVCYLANKKALGKHCRALLVPFLSETVAILNTSPTYIRKILDAGSTDQTLQEIRTFMKREGIVPAF